MNEVTALKALCEMQDRTIRILSMVVMSYHVNNMEVGGEAFQAVHHGLTAEIESQDELMVSLELRPPSPKKGEDDDPARH